MPSDTMGKPEQTDEGSDTYQPAIPAQWPTQPKTVSNYWTFQKILADIATVLVPIPFIVLAAALGTANGRIVEQETLSTYQNASQAAATLFPIAFAAVVGRLLSKIAAWRLEHGVELGMLEQLMGSKTVFSAVYTQLSLRSPSPTGIFLILLWALSPFGGQSVLRVLSTDYRSTSSGATFIYADTAQQSRFATFAQVSPASAAAVIPRLAIQNSLYAATLLTSSAVKASTMDLWGNVKIPYLSSYSPTNGVSDWIDSPTTGGVVYSSLVGIPLLGDGTKNSSFTLESTYLELQCSNITEGPILELNSTILKTYETGEYEMDPWAFPNGTFQGGSVYDSSSTNRGLTFTIGLDTFINNTWNASRAAWGEKWAFPGYFKNETGIEITPSTLLFQSYKVGRNLRDPVVNSTSAYCKVAQVYVESSVNCEVSTGQIQNCAVVAQRPSKLPHVSSLLTHLNFPNVFRYFSDQLPKANGQNGVNGQNDVACYYINNTDVAFMTSAFRNASEGGAASAVLYNIPEKQFSQRLGQILNSYLMLSQFDIAATGPTTTNLGQNLTTAATVSSIEQIYITSRGWLGIFILASLFLLLAALSSVILSHWLVNPEVLGSCSAMVRDSRYIQLPTGGSTLDGHEMTRQLKGLKLKRGVVDRSAYGVGTLGISTVDKAMNTTKREMYF